MKIQFNKPDNGIYDISKLADSEKKDLKSKYDVHDMHDNQISVNHYSDEDPNTLLKNFPNIKSVKEITPHLSLQNEFEIPEFKKFNVITGINGSGKTHFLKAIEASALEAKINEITINQSEIAFFDYLSFILNNEEAVEFDFQNLILQAKNHFESSVQELIRHNLIPTNSRTNSSKVWSTEKNKLTTESKKKFNDYFKGISLVRKIKGQNNRQQDIRYTYQDLFGQREDAYNITDTDIRNAVMTLKNKNDFLTDGFSILFSSAQITLNDICDEHDLKPSDAEIKYKEIYGYDVPWRFVNNIFDSYNSQKFKYKYSFNKPTKNSTQDLKAKLVDVNGVPVEYQNLSSGEKVLLTLSLFILQRSLNDNFPKVLLLDEIDATLHPSLCKNLIQTLKNSLVDKGSTIILATHNPSTIAFCDETKDGIFVIEDSKKIELQSKEKAIEILTDGFIILDEESTNTSIAYSMKNTDLPVLLTEGITDKIILEAAWKKLYEIEMPFYIQDCFDAMFIRNLLNRGADMKDGIFCNHPNKKFIGLFDFDSQGYNDYNAVSNMASIIEDNPYKCLTKSNEKKTGFAMLLPVSNNKIIQKQIIKNGTETYKSKSNMPIELLFYGIDAVSEYFRDDDIIGGGKVVEFKSSKRKRDFSNKVKDLEKEDFQNFKPIFCKIKQIIEF